MLGPSHHKLGPSSSERELYPSFGQVVLPCVVEDPAAELGQALGYLGLPWNDALMSFHKLDRVVRTPSSEQVRRPLNRDGMDVWKPYSEWLGPLREVLGELAQE